MNVDLVSAVGLLAEYNILVSFFWEQIIENSDLGYSEHQIDNVWQEVPLGLFENDAVYVLDD